MSYVYRWTHKETKQHYTGCHICNCKGKTCTYIPKPLRHVSAKTRRSEWTQEILFRSQDADLLFDYERSAIGQNFIGGANHDGLSLNKASGGRFSQATAQDEHIREKRRKTVATPEYKAKLRTIMNSAEVKATMLAAMNAPEYKAKISDANSKRWQERLIRMRRPDKTDYSVPASQVMQELAAGSEIYHQLNLCHDETKSYVRCRGRTASDLLKSNRGWRLGRPIDYSMVTVREAKQM